MATTPAGSGHTLIAAALGSWKTAIGRAEKVFSALTEEQLQARIAPGKNRLIYLWGHLVAVHDAMFPLLDLGPRLHPELDVMFLTNPDGAVEQLPSAAELKSSWDEVNRVLLKHFSSFTAEQWAQKHTAVSDEDFAQDPNRNRLAILLSRTNHVSFHLGQAILLKR